ncbi:hypothetical protein MTBSS4_80001 [Magnetospirillum sp. SS-4]|nr:hypothetical protein MTBSS4_80001 [Magnetospirillum sp. SS-4]
MEDVPAPEPVPASDEDEDEDDVLLLDQPVEDVPAPEPVPASDEDEDEDDVLLLDQPVEDVPAPEPAPVHDAVSADQDLLQQVLDALTLQNAATLGEDAKEPERETGILLRQVLAALTVTSQVDLPVGPAPVTASPADDDDDDDDVLLLGDAELAVASADMTRAEMTALIAAATPDGAGTLELPARLDSLARLLQTPSNDFAAQDLLHECWPRGSRDVTCRALLAVAMNLSRNFGMPGKLPMAATKAWRMLDSATFQAAMAARLAAIGDFITAWQKSQYTFLSLDFAEIELIEHLFESLHPGHNIELLASIMNFKVMSGRRIGLLRRIPVHARMAVEEMGVSNRDQALIHLAHVKALLARIADPGGFPPIVEAASRALIEMERLMKNVANPPQPQDAHRPEGLSGLPLARL